jgi:hypothetical protein
MNESIKRQLSCLNVLSSILVAMKIILSLMHTGTKAAEKNDIESYLLPLTCHSINTSFYHKKADA